LNYLDSWLVYCGINHPGLIIGWWKFDPPPIGKVIDIHRIIAGAGSISCLAELPDIHGLDWHVVPAPYIIMNTHISSYIIKKSFK